MANDQLYDRPATQTQLAPEPSTITDGAPDSSFSSGDKLVRPKQSFLFGRQLCFAIEEQAIQVAVSRRLGWSSKLVDVRKVYLPSTASATPELRQAFVTRTIDELLQELGGRRAANITVTVSGPETAFRQLSLPAMGTKELNSSIGFQARKTLPFPINDCWFDHRVTWHQNKNAKDAVRISLVGATRRHIDDRVQPFKNLGVPVHHCYLAQDVIGQMLRQLPDFSETTNYALIDIERTRSEMSYFRGSNLEFSHILSVGSSFLANRTDPTMFEYFAESLTSEIQNSLDYYAGQSIGLFGSRLYIYGDLSYSDELIDMLGNRFEFEFRRFPVEELKFLRNRKVEFASPLGVSLPVVAAAVNTAVLPNLVPEPDKHMHRRLRRERQVITGVLALFAVLALFWGQQFSQLRAQRALLTSLTNQANDFKSSDLFSSYQRVKLQIAASQNYLEQAKAKPSFLGVALKELTTLTPPAVRFQQFGMQPSETGRNFHIYGTVEADAAPPEVVLAEFVENLGASVLFDDVNIIHYAPRTVDGQAYLDFELEMKAAI